MWPLIDAYASLAHYREHLQPIWDALPRRGDWHGPTANGSSRSRWEPDRLVLVASYVDAIRVAPRPFVYVEHGAGQSYAGDATSARLAGHSGALGLDRCVLFVCPNEAVADRWRSVYEQTPVAVVGCPRLDKHHARLAMRHTGRERDGGPDRPERHEDPYSAHFQSQPTVAFTFHWDCGLVPETRSAWNHYGPWLHKALDAVPWRILGHGHPRDAELIERRWRRVRFAVPTRSLETVLEQADVLVADNTSAMWEFASLDKPIVVLDAPWYRRDVEHGLRFWTHADAGVRISHPSELREAIALALTDPPGVAARRAAAVCDVYSGLDDGHATERAVAAITAIMDGAAVSDSAPVRVRSETQNDRTVVLQRLAALGATNEEVAQAAESWDDDSPEAAEWRYRMVRMSDAHIRKALQEIRDEYPYDDTPPPEAFDQNPAGIALGVMRNDVSTMLPADAPAIGRPIPELLAWVAGDAGRARLMLDAELADSSSRGERPRKSLVARLETLLQ